MPEEIWKDIEGFSGYQVSNMGNVRGFRDYHGNITDTPHPMLFHTDRDGYYRLSLVADDHKNYKKRVNVLVAETFLGKHPGLVVDHINNIKTDNRLSNLRWITAAENSRLAAEAGLYKTKPVRIIETGETFRSLKECGDAINYHPSDIGRCVSGKLDSIRGLHFEEVTEPLIERKRQPFLYDYQMDAVNRTHNGSILCGSVGSGKSRTGLFYYFKENGGWIDEYGYVPMKTVQDLYIITTAKKRNDLEWDGELSHYHMSRDPKVSRYKNKVVVDSWNNLPKYKDVTGAFFLFDEQRLVGNGAWTKSFLKIAKNNNWILLSATPGDTYSDYLPVFIANDFFKNRTEFNRRHVIYSRYTKYPKIDGYVDTGYLDYLRDKILVTMDYHHDINKHHEDVYCTYDICKYKDVIRRRWDIYKDEPITQASGLCFILRRIVNSDESRQAKLLEIFEDHPKLIIFYNFNYELDILKNIYWGEGVEVAEYNGQRHQPVPKGDRWVYLCQYTSACEGWSCTVTDTTVFYSQSYSYKVMTQAAGRIDRLTTPFKDLYYYHLKSRSGIDLAISKALKNKKKFNESRWVKW